MTTGGKARDAGLQAAKAFIDTTMGHCHPRTVRMSLAIGKIIMHDGIAGFVTTDSKMQVPIIPIGGKTLGCSMRGKGDGDFTLPIFTLPANIGQFDMPDLLGNGTEGSPCPDRLQLLVITDEHDFCAARFDFTDKMGKLATADHAGLIDHEYVALAQLSSVVLPAVRP